MSSIGTGYDQSTTTYSPDGRVFQIEYAAKAVDNSGTAVGIRCKDGVVMGVEKPKLSKMLVEGSNRRIFTVDKHSGMCVSGLMADARQVVTYAREEANSYQDFYGGVIPGNILCDRVASLMHIYTLNWYAPPLPPPPPPPACRPLPRVSHRGHSIAAGKCARLAPTLCSPRTLRTDRSCTRCAPLARAFALHCAASGALSPHNPGDPTSQIDTSGVSARFFATAMGKVRTAASSTIARPPLAPLAAASPRHALPARRARTAPSRC